MENIKLNSALRLFMLLGIDKAILFVIIGRGFSVFSGVVTLLLISHFLTPEEQGYYYTFSSVVALQIIFELGLGTVLVQFSSHEMAKVKLRDGYFIGNVVAIERLYSLILLAIKWYGCVALLVLTVITPIGILFFDDKSLTTSLVTVAWIYPWLLLVFSASINILVAPLISVSEGCGLVINASKMRMYQALLSGCIAWVFLLSNNGLFACSATAISSIIVGLLYLHKYFKYPIIESIGRLKSNKLRAHCISWRNEIFPMQWRIAISWLSGYFIFYILNPVAFKFCGPVYAGQLGMSLTICNLVMSLGLAWITTKNPLWGKLIANGSTHELIFSFKKAFSQSVFFIIVLFTIGIGGLFLLKYYNIDLVDRVLPIDSFICLSFAVVGNHIIACFSTFVRAHKIEPFTFMSLSTALIMSITLYLIAKYLNTSFLMPSYAAVVWLYFLPYSFFIYKRFIIKMK